VNESLTPARAVQLVAGREIRARMRTKAFVVTTILMLVGVVGFIVVTKLLAGGPSTSTVGFTGESNVLAVPLESVAQAIGERIVTRTVDDRATGEQLVRNGRLDALVVGSPGAAHVVVKKGVSDGLRNALTLAIRQQVLDDQIRHIGGDPAAVNGAAAGAHLDVVTLQPGRANNLQRFLLGMVAGILVYISLIIYGQVVAQGVVEEKSNRIVEMLLTTIRPWQLMLGKVIGIGITGLTQIVTVAAVGLGLGLTIGVVTLPTSIAAGSVLWALLWFLLGFVTYALLFAAAGALVSRQEDVGGVTAPILMMLIMPYVVGVSILPSNPDSPMVRALSMVPLFSPTLMPMRVAAGVPAWQAGLSVALSVLLIAALVWLAGRVYGNAVLRAGARVKLSDALRAA
jgi:ABC-2 type transport system permease protein